MSVSVQGVSVSYFGDVLVLRDVTVSAQPGEVTAIIGPNGAGKTTLLKTIFGYLIPRTGRVYLDGSDLTNMPPYEKVANGLSYIPQERSVFPNMTVEENIRLGAWTFRRDKEREVKKLDQVLDRYPRLRERRRVKAGKLSGGEQRMLELGRALMTEPKVILFDEPSAGLAPVVAREFYDEMRKLADEGKTVLLVDQNIVQGTSKADQIYVLELGQVRLSGPRDQIVGKLKEIVTTWVSIS